MHAAALKEKIDDAKRRLLKAEGEMEKALHSIEGAERADKSMITAALSTALGETKAARQELAALEKVIAEA